MQSNCSTKELAGLKGQLEGDLHYDETMRILYATDASAYREMPLAVAIPKTKEDIQKLIRFAVEKKCGIIPRAAGTSLAGQVVGSGIVVDISKHFTKILEVNKEERWVRVEPGVIRNELNGHLKPYELLFGPETSTQNRAMMGGLLGNNACGSNSVVYGNTREHTLEVKGFLSDGSEVHFKGLSVDEFQRKCDNKDGSLESQLYQHIKGLLSDPNTAKGIRDEFPLPSISRRNTGYAIDLLLETEPFTEKGKEFNFCKLMAGSEGTLAFVTEIKFNLLPLPPPVSGLACVHFKTVDDALRANLIALEYNPRACELIDHYILECTKSNIEQSKNRFFVEGDPGAILVIELADETKEAVLERANSMEQKMRDAGFGYHFPVVLGADCTKVWTLRKAGLGLLANIPGDAKPVSLIEDTTVDVKDLPEYIKEVDDCLDRHGLSCVHHAHAGTGEIHLRPIIDLKKESGVKLFRTVAQEVADLVKKYRGSLSGEHGDGRLRGEFIKTMIGPENYEHLRDLKKIWDPNNVFNPGKITDTPPMDKHLRYEAGKPTREVDTFFDFSKNEGIVRAAEMCNGSGDCRKTHLAGGTMCPSYMATRDEENTTRARANILREILTHSKKLNPFDSKEIYRVMDLCLSCKGCKSECPSNVDIARFKAEFLQNYYDANGTPLRTRMIAEFANLSNLAVPFAPLYNLLFKIPVVSGIAKRVIGFAPKRSIPKLHATTFRKWFEKTHPRKTDIEVYAHSAPAINHADKNRKLFLFCDEFTNYNDVEIGKKTVHLFQLLGYEVILTRHAYSGRPYLSKGLLRKARSIAEDNIKHFAGLITEDTPLVGIEPSGILSFRDEYPDLLRGDDQLASRLLIPNTLMVDEFILRGIDKGHINDGIFTDESRSIKLHGQCIQKSIASLENTVKLLSIPKNYKVEVIPSGCCGMAGSFGYEHEHYELSMKIGELVLFPAVRKKSKDTVISAPGTSCRHQIHDGTNVKALHPVEILYEALEKAIS